MKKWKRIATYLVLGVILIVQSYPIFWIFMTSFKTSDEIRSKSTFALPESLNIDNYIRAIETSNLGLYLKNSLIVLIITITCLVLFSSTAAFAIEKMQFKINKAVLSFF